MSADRVRSTLRPLELLRVLRDHEVHFLVIGGVAVAAHGYVRGTKDVDIVPEPSRANLERLVAALTALDACPEIRDFRPEGMPVQLDLDGLAQGGNWALETRHGRLDLMQSVEGARPYETLRDAAIVRDGIAYVGLDDLIAMKHAAGRDLDHVDIRALEEARGATG
jgi:predicted nucleotidyltransferase